MQWVASTLRVSESLKNLVMPHSSRHLVTIPGCGVSNTLYSEQNYIWTLWCQRGLSWIGQHERRLLGIRRESRIHVMVVLVDFRERQHPLSLGWRYFGGGGLYVEVPPSPVATMFSALPSTKWNQQAIKCRRWRCLRTDRFDRTLYDRQEWRRTTCLEQNQVATAALSVAICSHYNLDLTKPIVAPPISTSIHIVGWRRDF